MTDSGRPGDMKGCRGKPILVGIQYHKKESNGFPDSIPGERTFLPYAHSAELHIWPGELPFPSPACKRADSGVCANLPSCHPF